MKAKRSDGKIVTLRIGEAVCGYGFHWVKIEPRDQLALFSVSRVERKNARAWLDHILGCKLMPKRGNKKPRGG